MLMYLVSDNPCQQLGNTGEEQVGMQSFFILGFTSRYAKAVVFPFHLWAYKLHGRQAAAQMGPAPFLSHWEGRIFRTAGNAVGMFATLLYHKPLRRCLVL